MQLISGDNIYIRITNLPMPNYCSPTLAFTFMVNINHNTGNIIFLHYGEQQEVNLGKEFISNIFNIEL